MASLQDILAARVGDGRSGRVGRARRPSHVDPQLWNRRPAPSRSGGPRELNPPPPQPKEPPRRPNPGMGDRLQPLPFNPNDSAGHTAVPMSYAGEKVQPVAPQNINRTVDLIDTPRGEIVGGITQPNQMSEQELMEMLFAAYQDRNMKGRNEGSRGFRGRPATGI